MRSALVAAALAAAALVPFSAAPAEAKVPSGYRNATAAEKTAMNKANGLNLNRKFAWFRGKKDPSYAVVCGYRSGGTMGVGLRYRSGRWVVRKNVPSGDLQNYDQFCRQA